MSRRNADDFEEDGLDCFDDIEDEGSNLGSDFEEEFEATNTILDDISIADIVNEYGIDGFSDAIIDSISTSDLEKLRDRLSEYLE